MPRDYYEVLGVARDADEAQIKKAFRRLARELHPDVNPHDPDAEEQVQGGRRGLRDPLATPSAARPTTATATTACAPAATRRTSRASARSATCSTRSSARRVRRRLRRRPPAGRADAGRRRRGRRARSTSPRPPPARRSRSTTTPSCAASSCHGNGAEPGTPIGTCRRCGGPGQPAAVSRTPFGQVVRTVAATSAAATAGSPEQPCDGLRRARARGRRRTLEVDVPAGIADGQRIRLTGRGHAGERGGPAGDLYVLVRVREDERFVRDGDDLVTVLDVPAPLAALGATLDVPTLDGAQPGRGAGRHPAGRDARCCAARACRRCAAAARGDLRVVVNVVIPRRLDAEQRDLLERSPGR